MELVLILIALVFAVAAVAFTAFTYFKTDKIKHKLLELITQFNNLVTSTNDIVKIINSNSTAIAELKGVVKPASKSANKKPVKPNNKSMKKK